MIPYGRHYLDEDDIAAVVSVLRHGDLTQGPMIANFEQAVAKYVGAKFAVAVSSGTAALHLSSIVAGFGPKDTVYTAANTFVANANCVQYVGAQSAFTDIDPCTLNMDPNDLLRRCNDSGNISGVIPVHFGGLCCDIKAIKDITDKFGAKIIEDASHALGGNYPDGSKVGNCKYSNMTIFSFHPVKGIAAGEGGMITTNSEHYYHKLLNLRSHGIYKGNFDLPGVSVGDEKIMNPDRALDAGELNPWYYEMQDLGFNYRITDIQCALALSQLKKIDIFIKRRRYLAAKYDQAFQGKVNFRPAQIHDKYGSTHHIYIIRINFDRINKTRKEIMDHLTKKGIGSQVHYIPVPMHPFYEKQGFKISDYLETSKYYNEALTLPLYYRLKDEEVDHVIETVSDILEI